MAESRPAPEAATKEGDGKWDPKSDKFRFVVLVIICFLYVGTSQAKTTPKNAASDLDKKIFAEHDFNVNFSLHSMPTIGLALVATCLMNHLGPNLTLLIFVGLCGIGQFIAALSFDPFCGKDETNGGIFSLFLIGRFINGVGVGAFRVAGNVLIKNWFPDKELSMVMTGFVRQGDMVGVIVDANVVPNIGPMGWRFMFGALMIGIAFASIFLLYLRPSAVPSKGGSQTIVQAVVTQLKRIWTDAHDFPPVYWVLIVILVCYDGTATPFMSMAGKFVNEAMTDTYVRLKWTKETIDLVEYNVRSCTKYVCIIAPLVGIMIDRYGKRCFWLFSMGITVGTSIGITTIMDPSELGTGIIPILCLLGLSHNVLSTCLWPVFGKVVNKEGIASAYGIASSINALANTFTPIIRDKLSPKMKPGMKEGEGGHAVAWKFGVFCLVFIGIGMITSVYLFIKHSKEIGNKAGKRKQEATELAKVSVDTTQKASGETATEAGAPTKQ